MYKQSSRQWLSDSIFGLKEDPTAMKLSFILQQHGAAVRAVGKMGIEPLLVI
jgi:hypothetical protein